MPRSREVNKAKTFSTVTVLALFDIQLEFLGNISRLFLQAPRWMPDFFVRKYLGPGRLGDLQFGLVRLYL